MDFFQNLDLFAVAISGAGILILGSLIYFSDRRSSTNQAFLAFSLMTVCWSALNYLAYSSTSPYFIIWLLRLAIFCAVWHSFFIFQLFYIFPEKKLTLPRSYKFVLLPLIGLTSVATLTPFVFTKIGSFAENGRVASVVNGPGIILFTLVVLSLVLSSLFLLIKKYLRAHNEERQQFKYITIGTFITFGLIIVYNFVFPAFLNNANFIPLGGVFILPFILCTSYAIIKHNLLNIKILATELLIFSLAAVSILEAISSQSLASLFFRIVIFTLVLIVGIFLVRSMRIEVSQKEELEDKTLALEQANNRLQELDKQKTDFLSIAAHQLRTPLSILNGYIELIKDGAYGKVGVKVKDTLRNMDESNGHLVKLVDEFLDITRIEQGRTKYDFKEMDICHIIDSAVHELKERAEQKGLRVAWDPTECDTHSVVLDEEKIRHVVFNFIDNAIKYSDKGKILIKAGEEKGGLVVRISDNGFGFNKIDEANFFQKFYRGENVKGTNVNGTGLGLYVCKKFIDGHQGRIWAHSEGLGRGSEFGFWVPFKQPTPVATASTVPARITLESIS